MESADRYTEHGRTRRSLLSSRNMNMNESVVRRSPQSAARTTSAVQRPRTEEGRLVHRFSALGDLDLQLGVGHQLQRRADEVQGGEGARVPAQVEEDVELRHAHLQRDGVGSRKGKGGGRLMWENMVSKQHSLGQCRTQHEQQGLWRERSHDSFWAKLRQVSEGTHVTAGRAKRATSGVN